MTCVCGQCMTLFVIRNRTSVAIGNDKAIRAHLLSTQFIRPFLISITISETPPLIGSVNSRVFHLDQSVGSTLLMRLSYPYPAILPAPDNDSWGVKFCNLWHNQSIHYSIPLAFLFLCGPWLSPIYGKCDLYTERYHSCVTSTICIFIIFSNLFIINTRLMDGTCVCGQCVTLFVIRNGTSMARESQTYKDPLVEYLIYQAFLD